MTGSRLGFSVGDWVIIKTVGAGVGVPVDRVGASVGTGVGTGVDRIGALVGTGVGFFVVGLFEGRLEGRAVGRREGRLVGRLLGRLVGRREGRLVGSIVSICNDGTMDGFQPESCPGVGLGDNWVLALTGTFAAPTVGFGVNTMT